MKIVQVFCLCGSLPGVHVVASQVYMLEKARVDWLGKSGTIRDSLTLAKIRR